jgi:BirA family biotin operon repressor/biotin-[acetyl-CoA-carboxylase] ligase
MSVVLTEIPSYLQDKMQFIAALSTLEAIRALLKKELPEFSEDRVQLKWTNDILLDGKKASGVLSEAIWSGSTLKGVVLGIGININQEYFSEEIAGRAIGLKQVLKFSIPLESIRDLMLASLEYTIARYSSAAIILDDLRAELEWMRSIKNFSLTEPDGTKAEGLRYDGISNDGALRVITTDGDIKIYQNATLDLS